MCFSLNKGGFGDLVEINFLKEGKRKNYHMDVGPIQSSSGFV